MDSSYTPVQYEYREIIEEQIEKATFGKVFYFAEGQTVDSFEGTVIRFEEVEGKGLFITMNPECIIRIDRIITLFGKPGAAYDEYDAFGNVCLSCTGGYPL
ncbi:MAG: hypothetical protein ABJA70_14880 [Chryseolinea sp.]